MNNNHLYMCLMDNVLPLNEQVIHQHIQYLKNLEAKHQLVLCGPFNNYSGGLVIIKANSLEEAKMIFEQDPFITYHYKTYQIRVIEQATKENNYLG